MALAICGIWWVRIARVSVHRVTSPRVLNDIPVRRMSARGYASSEKVDSPQTKDNLIARNLGEKKKKNEGPQIGNSGIFWWEGTKGTQENRCSSLEA